ncbi:cubilin-like [Saccostrea cucullata]|uniref:cubilin-like n=1 Tax=Saccostrea cuccullata TaxID=36930 RepID=UPI002ED0E56B
MKYYFKNHTYFSNLTLKTTIMTTAQTEILYINFLDCNIEYASAKVPYCQLDQITVYDGPFMNDSVLYQGCCLNDVTQLRSSGTSILLQFVSDTTVTGRGFYIQYYTNGTATNDGSELSTGGTIVLIVVLVIVFLTSVGVAFPLLYYKFKARDKFCGKILPTESLIKAKTEVDLQDAQVTATSRDRGPDLLKSCSQGTQDTNSSNNGRTPKVNSK